MGLLDDKRDAKQPQPDDDLWDDLLSQTGDEEPPEKPAAPTSKGKSRSRPERAERPPKRAKTPKPAKTPTASKAPQKSRSRAKGKGLSLAQLLILVLLGVVIVVAYLALAKVFGSQPAVPTTTSEATAETPLDALPTDAPPAATPIPPTVKPTERIPENTPTPVQTPTPAPPVATQFDAHIRINPDNVDMRLQRGAEYLRLGAYKAALADFEHARDIDEQRADVHLGLGQANYLLRNWPEAESNFLTAAALDPNLSEAHFGIGMLYYLQGRYQEAAKAFDTAAAINPDYAEAEAWLAIASAQSGDAVEAMGAAGRAISITQESAIVHIARAWAYLAQNPPNVDAAQGDLLYAQKLAPYDFELLIALARFYSDYRPERLIEAEQLAYYAQNWAKGDLERARALYALGHVYLAQNRKDDAKKTLAEAADLTTYQGQVLLFGVIQDLERALAP